MADNKTVEQRLEALEAENKSLRAQLEALEEVANNAADTAKQASASPEEKKPFSFKVGAKTYTAKVEQIKALVDGDVKTLVLRSATKEALAEAVKAFPDKFTSK